MIEQPAKELGSMPGDTRAQPRFAPADYLSLGQAARLAPGRPSTNCMWRWCRHGVLGRNGERICLAHVRVGAKIFTTAAWMEEFGRRVSEADALYFDAKAGAAASLPDPPSRRTTRFQQRVEAEPRHDIERELEAEGL